MCLFYKLCTDETEGCFLTAEEAAGVGAVERLTMKTVRSTEEEDGAGETTFAYNGDLLHDPAVCSGLAVCKYVFSVHNPSPYTQPRQVAFKVDIVTDRTQDIVPGERYVNKVNKGSYINYRILDSQFDLDHVYKVTV